jgi:hypothetical protein
MAAKRKRKPTLNQLIINKLLDEPKAIWKNKGIVSREMGFTKKLIEKYPLEAFWKALPLKFSAESLAWYISPQGWTYLKVEYAKFSMEVKGIDKHDISDSKFGENKIISKKTKTIEEFLKYGTKKENS